VAGAGAGCTTVRSVLLQATTAAMQITAAAKRALDVMVVSLSNSWFSNGDGKSRLLPIPQLWWRSKSYASGFHLKSGRDVVHRNEHPSGKPKS
jgi:hypothetical protein